jgi:hypothetical protein
MKKMILAFIMALFLILISIVAVVFVRPGLLINPKNLSFILHKTKVLKSWHWDQARFTHERVAWTERLFSGEFKNFCFQFEHSAANVSTCLEKISWDLNLKFAWGEGFKTRTLAPFTIRSSSTKVVLHPSKTPPGGPPDIQRYWKLFWSDIVPDMDFNFKKIEVKKMVFNLRLLKKEKALKVEALNFHLKADPKGFVLTAPRSYPLPSKLPLAVDPIHLIDVKLQGEMKANGMPLKLTGQLESVDFFVDSFLDLPLKGDFSSLAMRKPLFLKTKGRIELKNLKETISQYGPKPYNVLPAPFNVMNGSIITDIKISESENRSDVNVGTSTHVDLKSEKQALVFVLEAGTPLNVKNFTTGVISIDMDFRSVLIQLPRLSKKAPPPQFIPDGRFKKTLTQNEPPKKKTPMKINLTSISDKAIHLKTNLLDEILRLNFDLHLEDGKLQTGYLKILPLKTTVFKRPIRLEELLLNFVPNQEAVINAVIKFPLPEYLITLKLEGPVSKPRYAFQSKPPLPQSDIYAVLLFGRPMSDLDTDDKSAASKTNQLLSQGILSLSVLYFLSGSPVEYVGYDPNSKNATAQFGIGNKSSLRVGAGSEGVNSTAVRRSLGKGWYLDTSVQSPSTPNSQSKNYGVLLERIISY